jgi:ubiquinone/menaquinone biosynthesis C-methylase UbiE
MPVRKDTLFERYLAPIANLVLDRDAMLRYRNSKDWEKESDRFRRRDLTYPNYYHQQNFHGIEGGYLTADAAVTYDPVTQYALPPNEEWIRRELISRIRCKPGRILDLGCGTGSTTLLLKQAFPQAEVIGIDLSPYMLVVADEKAQKAGVSIQFRHAKAEQTDFPAASFDLVTASLLFHETPPAVSNAILQECFRLLKPGGEVLILDGNQFVLRQTEWLTEIFEEPYIKAYAMGSVDAWMGATGFRDIQTDDVWWVHQVTRGVKPLPDQSVDFNSEFDEAAIDEPQWAMG